MGHGLALSVSGQAAGELFHLIQDRVIGMFLHDSIMKLNVVRKVRGSWQHGVKRCGWRLLAVECPTERQVSWRTAYFSASNE
jgi:hypothetical protein